MYLRKSSHTEEINASEKTPSIINLFSHSANFCRITGLALTSVSGIWLFRTASTCFSSAACSFNTAKLSIFFMSTGSATGFASSIECFPSITSISSQKKKGPPERNKIKTYLPLVFNGSVENLCISSWSAFEAEILLNSWLFNEAA
ncbi:MAG: hypothetical protein PHH77_05070 [Victivallaceae bacterium]|nr:hypothetical protein [Victivallaceae bacterium]